jgi:hypothetical protein
MAINLIVLAVTLLMVGFLLVWVFCPRWRPWIEAPKYRVLTWDERFPQVVRKAEGAGPERTAGGA